MPKESAELKDLVVAVRLIRVSRPLPLAILVEGNDGALYHVRLTQKDRQRDVSAKTWICGSTALAVGLPMNPQRRILLSRQFIRELPSTAHHVLSEIALADSTTVVADLLVGPRTGQLRAFSFLPQCSAKFVKNKQDFIGMYLFDLWVERDVARTVLFRRTDRAHEIRATFVNDGSVLAGHHFSRQALLDRVCRHPPSLYEGLWSRTKVTYWLDLFRRAMPGALTLAVSSMPTAWGPNSDDVTLCQRLSERLEHLEMLAMANPLPDTAFWSATSVSPRVPTEGAAFIA